MSSASSSSCIMTPESDVESPPATSPSVSVHGHNARTFIRYLLERYSREEINRLVDEEASSSPQGHGRLPDAAFSQPFQIHSIPHQAAALLNHGGSFYPTMQAPNPRRTGSSNHSSQRVRRQSTISDRGSAVMPSAPQRSDYACGFCAEESIRKTCTRRNDLRRHIENFHNKDAVWFCQHAGCSMAYDWQSAYQRHLRTAHGRSHINVDEAMVKLCPQTIFACGFDDCTRVFEAPSEEDAATTLKEYSGHVVKHFEQGSNSGRWSYSTRLRNLLRQSQVSALWEKAWPEMERPKLQWDAQTSMAARKTLEAGHLENLPFLIRFMIVLGSDTGDISESEFEGGKLEPPVRERCPAPYMHRSSSLDTHAQSPQHDAERDANQFKGWENIHLESYGPGTGHYYGTMQPPVQQIPRSVEVFNSDRTVDRRQGQQTNYPNAGAGLRPPTPPRLFYHGPNSAMYGQSPVMLPAALQPHQHQHHQHHQHHPAAGQYVAVTHEPEPVVNPAGFHGMQLVTANIPRGMDVDVTGSGIHTETAGVHPGREGWMGHYIRR